MDKSGKWMKLEPLKMPDTMRSRLETVMPGYQSGLHRHEWIKHGTCYVPASAEEYYADSLWLMERLNESKLRDLVSGNIGRQVTRERISEVAGEVC